MTCAGLSRTWQRICEDDQTWRQKCFENGYVEFDAPSFRFLGGWAANRAQQAGITICSHMDFQVAQQNRQAREVAYGQCYERSPWKSLYLRKKRIISNWRSRAIQSSTVQKNGPGDSYQVSEDGKYIVSTGFQRGTVDVLCGQTGAQLHVLRGHTDQIRCIRLHGTTLVSGSWDQTLRVWNIVDGKCLHILAGEAWYVNYLQFDGKRVVFDGRDCTVKVWHLHTEKCLHTLTGHTSEVTSLLFEPERDLVVSGSRDGTIRVWDVQRGTCITHLVLHEWSPLLSIKVQLRGNILVSKMSDIPHDPEVKVWDIREGGSCLHHLHGGNGHTSLITSLQLLDSGLLVTASDDVVKLWDAEKGIFVRDLIRLQYQNRILDLKATETWLVCGVQAGYWGMGDRLIYIDFDASYP
ncbi:unnamed protein product, partial [Mesorhabditis belari]|uniref:F-box/WD repeat-containing protein 7 n=1 Tax=Mesorhabditis belari TaxID=2138241 RepID=A0AAF3J716_9BILA